MRSVASSVIHITGVTQEGDPHQPALLLTVVSDSASQKLGHIGNLEFLLLSELDHLSGDYLSKSTWSHFT